MASFFFNASFPILKSQWITPLDWFSPQGIAQWSGSNFMFPRSKFSESEFRFGSVDWVGTSTYGVGIFGQFGLQLVILASCVECGLKFWVYAKLWVRLDWSKCVDIHRPSCGLLWVYGRVPMVPSAEAGRNLAHKHRNMPRSSLHDPKVCARFHSWVRFDLTHQNHELEAKLDPGNTKLALDL